MLGVYADSTTHVSVTRLKHEKQWRRWVRGRGKKVQWRHCMHADNAAGVAVMQRHAHPAFLTAAMGISRQV